MGINTKSKIGTNRHDNRSQIKRPTHKIKKELRYRIMKRKRLVLF